MKPWLSIVGIGDNGFEDLTPMARQLIDAAKVFVGGARHLAMLPKDNREKIVWSRPLVDMVRQLVAQRGTPTCILASGDPLHFGIGVTFSRYLPIDEMIILPHLSAFSLAAARMGWALDDCDCLTLHGRQIDSINSYLVPQSRLLILSEDKTTPALLAKHLTALGFSRSSLTVHEHMGGTKDRSRNAIAAAFNLVDVADLNTIAVECLLDDGAAWFSKIAGLPDAAFHHDGQLTKQSVRAATLAKLMPAPRQILWDVGAGAGSIAIEWMRADRRCMAIAIEHNPERQKIIMANAARLGVPKLNLIKKEAPQAFEDLPLPDAIFIGGGITTPELFERCWMALKPGGRLVANAVTLEAEHILSTWHRQIGGCFERIAIQKAETIGSQLGWRAAMPVTQYDVQKQ